MIFITVGSQKFQFNRLIRTVDELVRDKRITDTVFAQIGYSDYLPKYFEYKDFIDRDMFGEMTDKADIVITHAGTGAIITALRCDKKVIAVPRLKKYAEHVDDHQMQIAGQFGTSGYIMVCEDCDKLADAIDNVRSMEFKKFVSNNARFIQSLEAVLEE